MAAPSVRRLRPAASWRPYPPPPGPAPLTHSSKKSWNNFWHFSATSSRSCWCCCPTPASPTATARSIPPAAASSPAPQRFAPRRTPRAPPCRLAGQSAAAVPQSPAPPPSASRGRFRAKRRVRLAGRPSAVPAVGGGEAGSCLGWGLRV